MQFTVADTIILKDFLKMQFPDSSMNTIQDWIRAGRVSVNSIQADKPTSILSPGDVVAFSKKEQLLPLGIKIVYEDKDIVVIYKPEGVLSVATDKETYHTAHGVLKRRFRQQRVYPVHRLDRDTSGIMLFTYTESARDVMKEAFEKKQVERDYIAVVHGHPTPEKDSITSYLKELVTLHIISSQDPTKGKKATTHYEVLGGKGSYSLVKLKLDTGRKNQIRVHLAERGHPIVGDEKYGSPVKKHRMCLHAYSLRFTHPISGKKLSFSTSIPTLFYTLTKTTPP